MTITELANEYVIKIIYDKATVSAIKKITKGNARWDDRNKVWRVPIIFRKEVQQLYEEWGARNAALARMELGTIPPMPELDREVQLQRKMFGFQAQGVAYGLERDGILIGDEPGLGKTTQAIGVVMARNAFPCLVICPPTLKFNWVDEWKIVAGKKAVVLDDSILTTWHKFHTSGTVDVFIVNYESIKRFFIAHINRKNQDQEDGKKKRGFRVSDIEYSIWARIFKSFIVDESHRCKDMNAQQTKFVAGLTFKQELVLALSGTPVVNQTKDLISQLQIINQLHKFGGREYFEYRYCKQNDFLPELKYKLWSTCFYQRKKKEVLKDLPDKIRKRVYCDISTMVEYRAAITDLETYLRQWLEKTDEQIEKSLRGEIMVKIQLCKKISAKGKLAEVFQYIDEITGAGEKVVLFCHHHEIAQKIKEQYPDMLTISGKDTPDQRYANEKRFQNDPRCKYILCSIQAASEGLNLTAASHVGLVEYPWHAAGCNQCEDRVHRIGVKNCVNAAYFLGRGTIDEYLYDIIEEKRDLAGQITGNIDDVQTEIIDRMANSLFQNGSFLNFSEN